MGNSYALGQSLKPGLVWLSIGILISGLATNALVILWPQTLPISPLVGYHLVQMVALYCITAASGSGPGLNCAIAAPGT